MKLNPLLTLLAAIPAALAQQTDPPGFLVQPGTGMKPEETVAAMKVPEGFKASLIAGEPTVHQPISFCFDDRGRIWVLENYSYPSWKPEGKDRILILEDKDGDGVAESSKVFYEGYNFASSIEWGFGGVWVGSAPTLTFIPDKNGDDLPDSAPEVVLDGWEHQDEHEMVNGFAWGPDGWLYGTQGVFTHSKVGRPGAPESERTPLNACVWRLHPQTKKFEVFAHGTSNPWGVDWDDRGQCFISACVIPHLYHIVQGGLFQRQAGRHFNPNAYADIQTIARHRHWGGKDWAGGSRKGDSSTDEAGGGHAHAGIHVYLGNQFPAEFRGTLLMNNIHGNRINNDRVERSGSGFFGDRRPDFMKSGDKWYRGLNIEGAPDGSVVVCDWYDARACHQQKPHDRTNGRLYRYSYGAGGKKPGDLSKWSDDQLVEAQASDNEWLVRHARLLLQARGGSDAVRAKLAAFASDQKRALPKRLRALWALHAVKGITPDMALAGLSDADETFRAWNIQLACESGQPNPAFAKKMAELAASDPSPVVRLYLASACQRIPAALSRPVALALAAHEEDAKDHNLPVMTWLAIEPHVADPAAGAEFLAACKIPKLQEFIARRMASGK